MAQVEYLNSTNQKCIDNLYQPIKISEVELDLLIEKIIQVYEFTVKNPL